MSEKFRAITHAHSNKSDGMVSPRRVVEAAHTHQMNSLVLTDHDTVDGIKRAREVAEKLGLTLVTGIEVTTFNPHNIGGPLNQKHVIGMFPSTHPIHVIPDSKPVDWVIREIHDQGGLVIIPHPEGHTASFGFDEVRDLSEKYGIDGIETINGIHDRRQELAQLLAEYQLAEIGASDSHFGEKDIATAFTEYTGPDLLTAIKSRQTRAIPGAGSDSSFFQEARQHWQAWGVLGFRRYVLRNLRRVRTIPPLEASLQSRPK